VGERFIGWGGLNGGKTSRTTLLLDGFKGLLKVEAKSKSQKKRGTGEGEKKGAIHMTGGA